MFRVLRQVRGRVESRKGWLNDFFVVVVFVTRRVSFVDFVS